MSQDLPVLIAFGAMTGEPAKRHQGEVVKVHVASANTNPVTELCIRTIHRLAGHPFELHIGDGGSGDGSIAMLREMETKGWVTLEIADGWRQHADWLDGWLAKCDRKFAVFVDSDVAFRKSGWLHELVDVALNSGAALVCADLSDEQSSYTHATTGQTMRLWPRPSAHLMLLDVAQVKDLGVSFAPVFEADSSVPEGTSGYDLGSKFYEELIRRELTCVAMPGSYARTFTHFGGLSWRSRSLWSDLWPGWHQARALTHIRLSRHWYRARFREPSPYYVDA